MKTPEPFDIVLSRAGQRYYLDSDVPHPESTADLYAEHKRFKPGELAAEVWKQEVSVMTVIASGGTPIRTLAKVETLERFATLPDAGSLGYR